jgi:hypothetical protein
MFYDYLVYFVAVWYILWPFGIFCCRLVYFLLVLVCCTKKNLATLYSTHKTSKPQRIFKIEVFFFRLQNGGELADRKPVGH